MPKAHISIRLSKRWFLSGAVLLVGLGALEIGQRVSDWRKAGKREANPYSFRIVTRDGTPATDKPGGLLFSLSPILTARTQPAQTIGPVTINRHGFRGPEIARAKTAGVTRVALLGGSTAFGHGASTADATVARRLEAELTTRTGRAHEVLNAACIAHHSQQELIVFATEVVDFAPDVIVVLDGWNDFYQAGFRPRDEPLFHALFAEVEMLVARAQHPLRNALRASALIRGIERRRARAAIEDFAHRPEAVPAYRRNLEQIVRLGRANGARVLLVVQPELFARAEPIPDPERDVRARKAADGYGAYAPIYAQYVTAAREVAAARSAGFLDATTIFDRCDDWVFTDWVHLNDRGNALLATAIAEAVVALEDRR